MIIAPIIIRSKIPELETKIKEVFARYPNFNQLGLRWEVGKQCGWLELWLDFKNQNQVQGLGMNNYGHFPVPQGAQGGGYQQQWKNIPQSNLMQQGLIQIQPNYPNQMQFINMQQLNIPLHNLQPQNEE